jgi:Na+/H+ antiporter NhaC
MSVYDKEEKWVHILKYISATIIISAMFLHAFDLFPYNIIVHIIGAVLWTIVGFKWKEPSILLNFLPQILILGAGLIYEFLL